MQWLCVVVLFWLSAFGLHDVYETSLVLGAFVSAVLGVGAFAFAKGWTGARG